MKDFFPIISPLCHLYSLPVIFDKDHTPEATLIAVARCRAHSRVAGKNECSFGTLGEENEARNKGKKYNKTQM